MFQIEELASLRCEEKDAILDAVLGMMYADEETQVEEVQLIKRYAAHFTDDDLDEVVSSYKPDLERVGRKIAHSDLGPTGRRVLVKSMALVAAASGDLDDRELSFYTQCLRAFGIPEARQKDIEKSVARYMYAELCLVVLGTHDGDFAAGRELLEETRDRLEIDEEYAKKIEKHARIEFVLTREV